MKGGGPLLELPGCVPVQWEGGLPVPGNPSRSFVEALESWHAVWAGVQPRIHCANLVDCVIERTDPFLGPQTVTESRAVRQAWVSSPWTAFGPYAAAEARKLPGWPARTLARAGAALAGGLARTVAPDRHRQVRAFLFSTPIHPEHDDPQGLAAAMHALSAAGQRPTLARGFAETWSTDLVPAARTAGLHAIATRVVWLYDGREPGFLDRHNTRVDLALARRLQPLFVRHPAELPVDVWAQLERLYSALYLERHNSLNPAYTSAFMARAARCGLLELYVFGDAPGRITAFIGLFRGAGQSTCPLVGVDTTVSRPRGLYRACCALTFGMAATAAERLNFSSGAGGFKRLRGGVPTIEWGLVAVPPAAYGQQRFWAAMAAASSRWAAPLVLRAGL